MFLGCYTGKTCLCWKIEMNLKTEETAKHFPWATHKGKGPYGARHHSWKIWDQSRRLPSVVTSLYSVAGGSAWAHCATNWGVQDEVGWIWAWAEYLLLSSCLWQDLNRRKERRLLLGFFFLFSPTCSSQEEVSASRGKWLTCSFQANRKHLQSSFQRPSE